MFEQEAKTEPKQESDRGTLCRPVDSSELFRGTKEIFIEHGGQIYRLTITRNDKLILQK